MTASTVLYIILAGLAALLLALFQYIYKSKRSKLNLILATLRFMTYFLILLLLVNPKFVKSTFYNQKPTLAVVIDNSQSIQHLDQHEIAKSVLKSIQNNNTLVENFNLDYYTLGSDVKPLDSLNFNEIRSNISTVFTSLEQVYKNDVAPMVIITDGNQTYGEDFEYTSKSYKQPIYTVILGDTITYSDLRIQQLNVNKYAYLKNKFPVEVFVSYSGNETISTQFIISSGNKRVYSKNLNFSKSQNSHTLELTIPADRVGINSYSATIIPLSSEKNTINNTKPFAVEVIDQKTNVALITSISHPDLGAFKQAIESNEQRSVSIISPNDYVANKEEYQLAILYQPNSSFRAVFDALDATNNHRFIITGTQTQWSFLNGIQNNYLQNITGQTEDFQPEVNTNYNTFIIDDLDFNTFPPLVSEFGSVNFNIPVEPILFKKINSTILDEPLLATFENNTRREALLIGEAIWKWRAQSYLNTKSFQQFDNFIGKLVQYLSSDQQRRRLNVNYESFYNGNGNIVLNAQFFNKNYEFDNKATLEIILNDIKTDETRTIPFVIKQNNYEVNLSGLNPSDYSFTVRANNGEASQSGSLTILDYNVEQQFLNADVTKLQEVATNSQGQAYFATNTDQLFNDLLNDSRYAIVQKSSKNVVPLIDFKILLALIALSLATEWFIRKYSGLI